MSTHYICFRGEIRKILCGYPLLSVAMCRVCECWNERNLKWHTNRSR